jgi:hypothetical protein
MKFGILRNVMKLKAVLLKPLKCFYQDILHVQGVSM